MHQMPHLKILLCCRDILHNYVTYNRFFCTLNISIKLGLYHQLLLCYPLIVAMHFKLT
nr:MAG TPA: hypothetical protein [Caudoviricetes sp.]